MEAYGIKFSEPKVVQTIRGERLLSSGQATDVFWATWKKKKNELKQAGFSVTKTNGGYVVNFWEEPDLEEKNKKILESKKTNSKFEAKIPDGLEAFPFQKAGIEWIVNTPSSLLGDEMGLGKTVQAIVSWNTVDAKRILIVCPASLKLNWARETKKWSVHDYRIHVIGPKPYRVPRNGKHVVIINYDILRKYHKELRAMTWDFLVADEAHYVKSQKAIRTKELLGFTHTEKAKKQARNHGEELKDIPAIPAERRLLMTGTPMTSKPRDLFPLLNYLNPTEWNNFFKFALRYCGAYKNGFAWDFSGSSNTDELNRRLRSTIMIRRLKNDVFKELPDKMRQTILFDATTAAERDALKTEMLFADKFSSVLSDLKEGKGKGPSFEEISKVRHDTAMAKLPKVIDHVLQTLENEDQIVVFCHHKDVLRGITEALDAKRVSNVEITGDVATQARQAAVDAFQAGKARVFLGTMGAAGVGLTLTNARVAIFAELDWNPSMLLQSEDRLHRIGQENKVLIQYLMLNGSLDARLAEIVIEKETVFHEILDKEEEIEKQEVPEEIKPRELPKAERPEKPAMSREEMNRIREDLNQIASMDSDRAQEKNDMGFNRFDSNIGHSLVRAESWSPRQAEIAKKLTIKYRRQLGK